MKRPCKRTFIRAACALALAIALVFQAAPAPAAAFCGMRNDVARDLEKDHGEVPVSWGLIGGTHIVEVFASPAGSFTIVVTRPDGLACVMAAGDGWQELEKFRKDSAI